MPKLSNKNEEKKKLFSKRNLKFISPNNILKCFVQGFKIFLFF